MEKQESRICPQHPYADVRLVHPWRMICSVCGAFLWRAEPPGLLQRPACPDCGGLKPVHLFRVIAANGAQHIAWWCTSCERYVKDGNRLFLPEQLVAEFIGYWHAVKSLPNLPTSVDALPLLKEHSGGEPCAICGYTKTEYNHFMPQVFKEDADIEPEWARWDALGAWLCDYHHRLWHAKIAPLWALAQVNGARTAPVTNREVTK